MNRVDDPLEKLNNNIDEVCPYLGLARDKETRYGYPDLENYCYRMKSPQPVSDEHQKNVLAGIAVIVAIFSLNGQLSLSPSSTSLVVTDALDALFVTNADIVEETSLVIASVTPTPVISPTPTISLTPTPVPTSTITPTASPTLGPNLGTPFGREEQYILHRVASGESLGNLAYEYDTSIEAIRVASNLREGKA
ncbi:MAG: hypothetical protein B6I38_11505, partial [Anaerolineaceae bacterium 4572_5.1]